MPAIYCADLLNPEPAPTDPLEQIELLYKFLQGQPVEGIVANREQPKLSPKQAFTVIWFLQEKLQVFPDTVEQCCSCKTLFDSASEGYYVERLYRHYCDGCLPRRYEGIAS